MGVSMNLGDIAKECGVSMMTVSNVINGNNKKVSAATIEKVNAVIKKYDYVPNFAARTLSSKSSHLILLAVPFIREEDLSSFYNEYLMELVSWIERELLKNGYFMMLRSVFDEKDVEVVYRNWNIDGTIFLFPMFDDVIRKIKNYKKKNFIVIDGYTEIDGVSISRCADRQGGYISTRKLIENGHKKILFAADYTENPLLERRHSGYVDALDEAGLECSEKLCARIVPNYEGGLAFGRSLERDGLCFTAIVATSDMCAFGIIAGAREKGLSVPEDFSIIGFDNLPLCDYSSPGLTSVNQNIHQKAENAVRLVVEKITGKDENSVLESETEIFDRDSVKKI